MWNGRDEALQGSSFAELRTNGLLGGLGMNGRSSARIAIGPAILGLSAAGGQAPRGGGLLTDGGEQLAREDDHARFAAGCTSAAPAACNLDAADPSATRVAHRRDGGGDGKPIYQRAEIIRCDRCGRLVRSSAIRRGCVRCSAP